MNNKYAMRFPRVVLGFLTSLASGVLLTWSYYREPLLQLFPTWTTSDLSLIFSVHNIVVSVMMAVAGFTVKKISTRLTYSLVAICLFVGLGGFYFLPVNNPDLAYIMAFAMYGVIAPMGVGASCLLNYSLYPAWYPERSGMVSGTMIMAFNTCALITGAIAGAMIPSYGIQTTLLVTGILVAVLTLLSVPFGVYPGPNDHLPPKPVRPENKSSKDYTLPEMLKTAGFWVLFIYHAMIFGVGLILADHAAGIALSFGIAALFGLLFSPAKGVSCLAIGWLMDKLSTIGAMLVIDGLVIVSALVLLLCTGVASSSVLVLIGLILCGLGVGGVSSIKASAIRFLYGSKNYEQNYGFCNLNIAISAILVYLASMLIEAMGGSYQGVFVVIMGIGVLALGCTVYLHFFIKRFNSK